MKILIAMSGGVDSSVVAALVSRAIGNQVTCVFVNHGLLRKDEPEQVEEVFTKQFDEALPQRGRGDSARAYVLLARRCGGREKRLL